MEQYLQKEAELIKQTDFVFTRSSKVFTKWYSVINEKIEEHSRLINVMMCKPDYVIFERFDGDEYSPALLTLYFDKSLNIYLIYLLKAGSYSKIKLQMEQEKTFF